MPHENIAYFYFNTHYLAFPVYFAISFSNLGTIYWVSVSNGQVFEGIWVPPLS
jgi:hypothetical protein